MNQKTAKLLNKAASYAGLPSPKNLKREWLRGNRLERTRARRRLRSLEKCVQFGRHPLASHRIER